MIKYFTELENKSTYYLPLINKIDNGKKILYDYKLPLSFIEKYSNLFQTSTSIIMIYKNYDIDKWYEKNKIYDYENACTVWSNFNSLKEDGDFYWILEDYNKINPSARDIELYFLLLKKITLLFEELFPEKKEYYHELNNIYCKAIEEINKLSTINYTPIMKDDTYLPDAWFITPNNYLYNPGKDGHKGCDLTFSYNRMKESIITTKKSQNPYKNNEERVSTGFIKLGKELEEKGYITENHFKLFLNYISQPAYLEEVDGMKVTREKHIVETVIGIIMAHGYFHRFFEEFKTYIKDPIVELDKLEKYTSNYLPDILVRCCGFHKIESVVDKTITTSCLNYEKQFEEYIARGWKINFIPPLYIDRKKGTIEEYPEEFLIMNRLRKDF